MTYLQLMMKCLKFFKDDNNKFDSYEFYYHWLRNEDDDVEDYYKDKVKKAIMYLFMLETVRDKKVSDQDAKFLKFLEEELAYFDFSMTKTMEKAEKKVEEEMQADPYLSDRLLLLEIDELSSEEANEIFWKYTFGVFDEINKGLVMDKLESGIHRVMEMVSQIIPELYFTEKGYKCIDKEYQIEDEELRDKCYEYLKNNICYYNSERIYKVNESLYDSDLYELSDDEDEEENNHEQDGDYEEEYDEVCDDEEYDDEYDDVEDEDEYDEEEDAEEFDVELLDNDELRSEVDVWSEDIDNFDILFYSVTLLSVVFRFIKNKEYDKLDKLIELDEKITNNFWEYGAYQEKTAIEAFYQPKSMGRDYRKEITVNPRGDYYLDFFLSDNELTRQYDVDQLALIVCYCFDYYSDDPIGKIINNIEKINEVLVAANNSDEEDRKKYEGRDEKIKQFYMIRTNNQ